MNTSTKSKNDCFILTKQAKIAAAKENAVAVLGEKNFQKVYEFLQKERASDHADDYIKQKIGEMVGREKKIYDTCFLIDQILFLESFNH